MKTIDKLTIISLCLLFSLVACQNNDKKVTSKLINNPSTASNPESTEDLPKIEFRKTVYDFGKIIQGEKVSYSFLFQNTGVSDLIITEVNTSCGCTASKFPKTPIKPGQKKFIEVSFDSEGRKGFQNKTITVVANTQPSGNKLAIKAMVVTPERS